MAWDSGRRSKSIRLRTTFSKDQLDLMEKEFAKNDHPDMAVRERISRKLNLTTVQVSIWFKNRRARAKKSNDPDDRPSYRRNLGGSEDDDVSDEDSNSFDESNSASGILPPFSTTQGFSSTFPIHSQTQYMSPATSFQQQQNFPPPLVSPTKQDFIPTPIQQPSAPPPSQDANVPSNQFLFVPNHQQQSPAGVFVTPQTSLPPTFHQTAWAVIPAQHFNNAGAANPLPVPNHATASSAANIIAPPTTPLRHSQSSNIMHSNTAHFQTRAQHVNLLQGTYHAEREFFGDKYVIQPYLRPEYSGGLQPIFYATDEDGPPC